MMDLGSPFAGRSVLVVEDEMMVAWMLEDQLAELGCTVVGPAATIAQALAMIDAETIDIALLDVNLNGEMSYPVADALTQRGVPFVFSTGYEQSRLRDGYRTFPILGKTILQQDLRDMLLKVMPPRPAAP